jgi:hypothetical protein
MGLTYLSESKAHYELWQLEVDRNIQLTKANWRCSRGWSEAELRVSKLTELYMKQCDAQAYLAVEKVVASAVGEANQKLMTALTDSAAVQFAYGPKPPHERQH